MPRVAWLDGREHQHTKAVQQKFVWFAYMEPEVFYIHKHCLTESCNSAVVVSIAMGLCASLTSKFGRFGWMRLRVQSCHRGNLSHLFSIFFPACSPLLHFFLHSFSLKNQQQLIIRKRFCPDQPQQIRLSELWWPRWTWPSGQSEITLHLK